MAIYHFSAKMISRANGSSALAAAAYRCAGRLHDQRLDRHHDFSNKAGVVHSEVLLPGHAPEAWRDRERLWNDVEAAELRKDAQLAREIEFALPRELDQVDAVDLARGFVEREFVSRGMVADLNVHWDIGEDGLAKPHAHVMLTTREIGANGFGAKVRDWNRTDLLEHWREAWADHVNQRLAERDIDARVDHRSLEAQGIALEPQHKIGPAGARRLERGEDAERATDHLRIARENGARIVAEPRIALDAITHQQATFTDRDLAKFVHRHSDGKEQYDQVFAAMRGSPELVALGRDGRGEERFTSREMLATEQRLERATIKLEARVGHGMAEQHRKLALARAEMRGLVLSSEQQAAFDHVTRGRDLGVVIGYAGTGKSAMLGVAREAWESANYSVRGAALSGIAAENLEQGSGIASRTIASLEHQWSQDRDLLTSHDVLVIDEAGMIGTRQLERVVAEAEKRGAKLVLVGDPEQLQAIEAGAAFRAIAERDGHVEITEIRRQQENWQRRATRELATDRTDAAIAAYERAGHVHAAETREAARVDLIERWDRDRSAAPNASRIILTHANDEVRVLNEAGRERLRARGELGDDARIVTERGPRDFAAGDRVMFLKNERGLGVKNGSLGSVQSITSARMAVLLDDGRAVAFDLKDYNQLDHGYAATIHKAQGMTVNRVHVLATPGLDRHAAYVALSRHRDQVVLHYGRDDFADRDRLVATLSRERGKDMASDYPRAFSDRRAIVLPANERAAPTPARDRFAGLDLRPITRTPGRSMFDGLRLSCSPALSPIEPLDDMIQRVARAAAEVVRMRRDGYSELPHQRTALEKARDALNARQPDAWRDLRAAFSRNMGLIDEAAQGRTANAIRAMQLETELRLDPAKRADRYVGELRTLASRHHALRQDGNEAGAGRVGQELAELGKSLERDAQAESLVRKRLPQLGIPAREGVSISHSIQQWLGRSRDRGLGL